MPMRPANQPSVPVFLAADMPVADWLKPIADKPGEFRTDGVGRSKDVDFLPFYRLHRHTYGVYWDLFTPQEWEQKSQRVRRRAGKTAQTQRGHRGLCPARRNAAGDGF